MSEGRVGVGCGAAIVSNGRILLVKGEARNLEPEKAEAVAWFALSDPPAPLGQAAREAIARLASA